MRLMDRLDRFDMDVPLFNDPEMEAFFDNPFGSTARRMSGPRVVPVHLLGSSSNLSAPRGPDGRASVSPSPARKFDAPTQFGSLPRQMPSHQQRQPSPNPQPQPQQQTNQRPPTPQQQPQPQQQQQQYQPEVPPKPTVVPVAPSPAQPQKLSQILQKRTSIEDFGDRIVDMLDDVERRVEQFRETAAQLEAEKETILEMLNSVNLNTEMMRMGEGEREDINAITNRLLARTKTVDVLVNTPRNAEQAKALESVNGLIEGVMGKLQQDLVDGKEICRRYLNACSPDQPEGPIDQRFQAQIIECTADDQKKIRRKLAHLIQQVERAERTCFPQY